MNILAIDVGTSRVQAVVVDAAGLRPIAEVASVPIACEAPVADAAEIAAPRLWEAVSGAVRLAVQKAAVAGVPDADVGGIGLSTFMPGLVLLGKDDQPLGPIWTHLDRRSRPAARQVGAHVGDELAAHAGNRPLPGWMSALSWRQQHGCDPYLSHRTASYLHVNGWLAFHATGVKAFDPANACTTGLYGTLADQTWSSRWCDYFEIDRDWLPPVIDSAATVGVIRAAIAAELGVPAGIPVKLGAADLSMTMLALRMQPTDRLHISGPVQTLAVLTDQPRPMPRARIHRLGVGSSFTQVSENPVGTNAVEWLRGLCFRDQPRAVFYERTIPLAAAHNTRVRLDPPFFIGDNFTIEAGRAAFRDLDLTAEPIDLLAALLNEMKRRHEEAVANLGPGGRPSRVLVAGPDSEMLRQIIPGYEGLPIVTCEQQPLIGIARLFS